MENASKALIIAGAILIAVALISLFIFVFSAIGEFNSQTREQQYSNQVIAANRFFVEAAHDVDSSNPGIQIYGYDAYNIIRKAEDVNNDVGAPVTIDVNMNDSYFGVGTDGIVTADGLTKLKKKFRYSYEMDSEGYVIKITLSEV